MRPITVSITNIAPSKLFLIRWVVLIAKARLHIREGKKKRVDEAMKA